MSKRDTIIIAVLVNAGLLLVLFATAMRSKDKPDEPKEVLAEAPVAQIQTEATPIMVQNEDKSATSSQNGTADLQIPQDLALTDTLVENQSETLLFSDELDTKEPALEVAPKEPTAAPVVQAAPQKAPAKVAKIEPAVISVTVKKGDFLERIAKTHQSTVALIMKANNLTSTQLKIGQVLKVPVKEKDSSKEEVAKAVVAQEEFYVVKEGDSPWLIASRNHIKLDDLMRLNNMDEQKARRLRPGDRLRIR